MSRCRHCARMNRHIVLTLLLSACGRNALVDDASPPAEGLQTQPASCPSSGQIRLTATQADKSESFDFQTCERAMGAWETGDSGMAEYARRFVDGGLAGTSSWDVDFLHGRFYGLQARRLCEFAPDGGWKGPCDTWAQLGLTRSDEGRGRRVLLRARDRTAYELTVDDVGHVDATTWVTLSYRQVGEWGLSATVCSPRRWSCGESADCCEGLCQNSVCL